MTCASSLHRCLVPFLGLTLLPFPRTAETPAESAAPCEVIVLGIDHVYYGEGYRPAHLRAFFAAVRPTAMGIENPPSFQARGELRLPLHEAKEALAYSSAHALPVYGVDWDPRDVTQPPTRAGWETALRAHIAQVSGGAQQPPPPTVPRPAGLSAADASRLRLRRGLEASTQNRRFLGGDSRAMEFMNSADVVASLGDDRMESDPFPDWKGFNATVVEHIRAAARKHPGGRLLVVYGGLHKPLLDAGLAQAPEVRLRQPTEWFPLNDKTVSQFDTPDDLKLLFMHTTEDVVLLSNPDALHRPWLRTQVAPLEKLASTDLEARYYLARWLTLEGQWEKATQLLKEVADEAKGTTLAQEPILVRTMWFWPPDFGLRRRALFALALVHDLAGRRDAALTIYDGLRDELGSQVATEAAAASNAVSPAGSRAPASPASRFVRWVGLFLAEPYIDHPDQYLKALAP